MALDESVYERRNSFVKCVFIYLKFIVSNMVALTITMQTRSNCSQ